MKNFNKQLNVDINQLKKLHAKKDKSEFNLLKSEIMKRHSVSKATVYREMKKDTPGLFKRPQYNPPERPVTERERRMVEELLIKQFKVQDIIQIMEREFSQSYSWDRIDRIRGLVESEKLKVESEKQVEAELHEAEIPQGGKSEKQETSSLKIPLDKGDIGGFIVQSEGDEFSNPPKSPFIRGTSNDTAFGENLRVFFEEIMDADKIADGRYLNMVIAGRKFRFNRGMLKDIALIITNYTDAGRDKQKLVEMTRVRLYHMVTDKIRLTSMGNGVSVKELKELHDMNRLLSEGEQGFGKPKTIRDLVLEAAMEEEEEE